MAVLFALLICSFALSADDRNDLKVSLSSIDSQKVVLVTGASRGIGFAIAERLAKQGYRVYAGVRSRDSLQQAFDEKILIEILDVTDRSTIQKTVSRIIEREGRLDILINNAGYALAGPLECLTEEEILQQMNVNFFGVIRVCQEVLPYMRKQKNGHILNVSSTQGTYGLPYGSLYTSSKAALESLSAALSIEVLPWNIKVSIVEPGFVATNFSIQLGSRKLEENPYESICRTISDSSKEKREPSWLCQSPEEIALFLQAVIEDAHSQLRYQTSASALEEVSQWITDLSGKEYSKWMKELINLYY